MTILKNPKTTPRRGFALLTGTEKNQSHRLLFNTIGPTGNPGNSAGFSKKPESEQSEIKKKEKLVVKMILVVLVAHALNMGAYECGFDTIQSIDWRGTMESAYEWMVGTIQNFDWRGTMESAYEWVVGTIQNFDWRGTMESAYECVVDTIQNFDWRGTMESAYECVVDTIQNFDLLDIIQNIDWSESGVPGVS